MKILITGGSGFIGQNLIQLIMNTTNHIVLNCDKLSYASNHNFIPNQNDSRYHFRRIDICDKAGVEKVFHDFAPDAVMHLAAESHVDRSIVSPDTFIQSNIIGTYTLLEVARKFIANTGSKNFRFHHISTDEVYGDLLDINQKFSEEFPYAPSSPYSASKAASDHLVRAWGRTYDLPIVVTNCSNNYGPWQYTEKLIPLMIYHALSEKPLPIYGQGNQIRDWLYVEDHARALLQVLYNGQLGETYNVGGNNEKKNIEVVTQICHLLDDLRPKSSGSYTDLISFVQDRPGHDLRYAVDANKIACELGWQPLETFETGLEKTVHWYLKKFSTQIVKI